MATFWIHDEVVAQARFNLPATMSELQIRTCNNVTVALNRYLKACHLDIGEYNRNIWQWPDFIFKVIKRTQPCFYVMAIVSRNLCSNMCQD